MSPMRAAEKAGQSGAAPSGPERTHATAPPRSAAAAHEARRSPSPADPESAGLALLLRIEAMARAAADLAELRQLMCNETRKLNRARQIFAVRIGRDGHVEVQGASGVTVLDQRSPLVEAVRDLIARLAAEHGLAEAVDFTLPAFCDGDSDLATAYPFREMKWVPLRDRSGRVFGGLLMAREMVWTQDDYAVSTRLAATYAHAWRELATAATFEPERRIVRPWRLAAAAVVIALALPLPMTALAPAEIIPREPMIVSAPVDGVIDQVAVDPGTTVKAGDVLVRLSDTVLKNRLEVARQEVRVAEAKTKQATLLAFSDARGRHDLVIAQADLSLKKAEHAYAADLLARSVIRAQRDGLAIYPDRKTLTGKPVAAGERIMEIADPASVEMRIDLAVPDAMALKPDSRIKLFLDVDPLEPWGGEVVRSDYRARPSDGDVLSFRTIARLDADTRPPPRIGLRGTAQIYGDRVPLVLFLLRRPISAARQWIGI